MANNRKNTKSNTEQTVNPATPVIDPNLEILNFEIPTETSDNEKQYGDKIRRMVQNVNRVAWTSGKNGIVRVTRLVDESREKVNELNKAHSLTFERVFVADYRTVYHDEPMVRRLGAIGITADKRAYLLNASGVAAIKTPRGEEQKKLNNMIATVQKAVELAQRFGLYDEHNMSYDGTSSANNGERAFVNAVVTF